LLNKRKIAFVVALMATHRVAFSFPFHGAVAASMAAASDDLVYPIGASVAIFTAYEVSTIALLLYAVA